MPKLFAGSVITIACGAAIGFITVSGVNHLVAKLQADTITQCQQKLWPAHQAKAHEAFCKTYLSENALVTR